MKNKECSHFGKEAFPPQNCECDSCDMLDACFSMLHILAKKRRRMTTVFDQKRADEISEEINRLSSEADSLLLDAEKDYGYAFKEDFKKGWKAGYTYHTMRVFEKRKVGE